MMMARVPPVPTSIPSTWITPPRPLQTHFCGEHHIRSAEDDKRRASASEPLFENFNKYLEEQGKPSPKSAHLVGHEKKRTHLKARILRTQPLRIVLFFDIDKFLCGGDGFERNVVVVAVFEDHQASADVFEQQVQSEVPVSHRRNGVNGVGIAAAHQVAQLLIDDVDSLAIIEFGGEFTHFFGDDIADST